MALWYAFTTFSCPDLTLGEAAAVARALGYAGVELRVGYGHRHGVEPGTDPRTLDALRADAERHGIAICGLGIDSSYVDPALAQRSVADALAAIDVAAAVDGSFVRLFAGELPAGMSADEALTRVAGALRPVLRHAGERGVRIALETHDDWSAPARMAELVRALDDPCVRVVWDVLHTIREGGVPSAAAYETLAPWIEHVHVHDAAARLDELELRPLGGGDFERDHREALAVLLAAGYEGFVAGEWFDWEPFPEHLPRELATLHAYEAAAAGDAG